MLEKIFNTVSQFIYTGTDESKKQLASYLGIKDYTDERAYSDYFVLKARLSTYKDQPKFEDLIKLLDSMYETLKKDCITIKKHSEIVSEEFLDDRFILPERKNTFEGDIGVTTLDCNTILTNVYTGDRLYKSTQVQKNIFCFADAYELNEIVDLISKKLNSKSETTRLNNKKLGVALSYLVSKEVIKAGDLLVAPWAVKDLGFIQGLRNLSIKDNNNNIHPATVSSKNSYYVDKTLGFMILNIKDYSKIEVIDETVNAWIIMHINETK